MSSDDCGHDYFVAYSCKGRGVWRLLRYCARPPFAMDRLRKEGAALVPPPRTHRHRYFGVLAPNSPLRCAAVALAAPAKQVVVQTDPANISEGAPGVVPLGQASPPTPKPATPKRSKAHYLWAVLIARIYEVFPLLCPKCGGQMRLIAFITEGTQIKKILGHIGVDSEPPQISPARGPPLWDDCDAQTDEGGTLSPIGIWRRNRRRTLSLISASVDEWLVKG